MSEPQSNRRQLLEQLAGVVSLQGWKDFEVSLDSDEFRIEKHGGSAVCTVTLLPQDETFQAHFAFPNLSVSAISFQIGDSDALPRGPASLRVFRAADQAARWLLHHLESTSRARVSK